MFLCKECHKKVNCESKACKLSGPTSIGPCEMCRKVDMCYDCHGSHKEKELVEA